jgi:hypothetical protein
MPRCDAQRASSNGHEDHRVRLKPQRSGRRQRKEWLLHNHNALLYTRYTVHTENFKRELKSLVPSGIYGSGKLKEVLKSARYVVKNGLNVSETLLKHLKKAITDRELSIESYNGGDEGHVYCLYVLKDCWAVLSSKQAKPMKKVEPLKPQVTHDHSVPFYRAYASCSFSSRRVYPIVEEEPEKEEDYDGIGYAAVEYDGEECVNFLTRRIYPIMEEEPEEDDYVEVGSAAVEYDGEEWTNCSFLNRWIFPIMEEEHEEEDYEDEVSAEVAHHDEDYEEGECKDGEYKSRENDDEGEGYERMKSNLLQAKLVLELISLNAKLDKLLALVLARFADGKEAFKAGNLERV